MKRVHLMGTTLRARTVDYKAQLVAVSHVASRFGSNCVVYLTMALY